MFNKILAKHDSELAADLRIADLEARVDNISTFISVACILFLVAVYFAGRETGSQNA